jgi:hypothetical protein
MIPFLDALLRNLSLLYFESNAARLLIHPICATEVTAIWRVWGCPYTAGRIAVSCNAGIDPVAATFAE